MTGWIPAQHGAWAMLVVPFVVGGILLLRAGVPLPTHLLPLFATWMLGYFTFNAVSLWLKAAPVRRPQYVRPTLTYAAATAITGLLTLVLAGLGILAWLPVFAVLMAPAFVLAAQRHERATLGGALTTAAASVMTLVVTHPSPAGLLDATARPTLALAALVFAYFFGTVLYVKTNIRERDSRTYFAASVGWHAALTLLSALGAAVGLASPWWIALFALATVRAIVVPRRRPRLTPMQLGLLEIVFCVGILLIAAVG